MKKYIIILSLFIASQAYPFVLNYTIGDNDINEVTADYVYVHENNETKCDPEWVDPEDGSDCPRIPRWTDKQWVKEHIRRWVTSQIKRSRQKQARDNANAIGSTDGLVQ